MKIFKLIIIIFSLYIFSLHNIHAFGTEIPPDISNAIKVGNSSQLAKYFNISIKLTLLENEDMYSKEQAEQIIKNFFIKNPPKSFVVKHEGGKENSQYFIGDLNTASGIFRVTLLLKMKDNKPLIHQLRIIEKNE